MLASTLDWMCNWAGTGLAEQALAWTTLLAADAPLLTRWINFIAVGLQVAAGLGFVIFVHELGHFLAAKTFGVKCDKFYVGFDVPISIGPIRLPRTLGKFRWGETEYGIGIVPLGGYVKMLGQDDDPRNAEAEAERIRQGGGPDAPLDPRSYQAKPVWQRMIIISAGVVMNVIFAVFLAAAAFLYGVPYTPTIIGGVQTGSPAWEAGLKPGDQVVQMAKMTKDDPFLRFEDMGSKTVLHGLKHNDAQIPFTVVRDGTRTTLQTTPTKKLHPDGFYLVGINSASIATIGHELSPFSYLAAQKVDIKKGDRVIATDGVPLPIDTEAGEILASSLTDRLQAKWNQPIELTVLRGDDKSKGGSAEELKVTLPPVPAKSLGFGFAIGPVTSIKRGSTAEVAGMKVGDVIQSVDGQPVTDAMRLPMIVAEKRGKPIEFIVHRASKVEPRAEGSKAGDSNVDATSNVDAQNVTIVMQSDEEIRFGNIGATSGQTGLENFGIAYSVLPKVASIDPSFDKAVAGVQIGDELTQMKLEVSESEIAEFKENDMIVSTKEEEITALRTAASFFGLLQQMPEGLKVRCYMKRNKEVREVVLPLAAVKDWYWSQRGIALKALEKKQVTENAVTALGWGVTETGRRLGDVAEFLGILVTGRASPRALAGPFGIAEVAAHEASNSPSRLLLFLTLLSANLAILNFLPIPALDGGHMMFLGWEAVRGKPLNEAMQVRLTMVGVMCLLGLMAFAILNDILRKIM